MIHQSQVGRASIGFLIQAGLGMAVVLFPVLQFSLLHCFLEDALYISTP
jgi:hypothetical protein